jgi:hypothetical protein
MSGPSSASKSATTAPQVTDFVGRPTAPARSTTLRPLTDSLACGVGVGSGVGVACGLGVGRGVGVGAGPTIAARSIATELWLPALDTPDARFGSQVSAM